MICPACGYRDTEEGEHRCARCGRRLERPAAAAPAAGGSAPSAAVWKQEVAERYEQFQNKRARQPSLFADASPEAGDQVPAPDLTKKVIAFEDIGAERIEPLVVQPRPARPATPRRALPPLAPAPPARLAEKFATPESVAPHSVTPVAVRALAGLMDLSMTLVATGVFLGIFHLLGGELPASPKALVWMGLAAACLVSFYFFVWICYGSETPGLQWMGLCVMDYEGRPPRAGPRLVRAVGVLLSAAALGLGYLWALADEETLTWHDRMSKTFVTRDPDARRAPGESLPH